MGDFEECGEIVSLRLPKNEEGKPRGIAFIEYKDKESCEKAIKFDGEQYAGRSLKVKMAGDPPDSKGKGKDGKEKARVRRARDRRKPRLSATAPSSPARVRLRLLTIPMMSEGRQKGRQSDLACLRAVIFGPLSSSSV